LRLVSQQVLAGTRHLRTAELLELMGECPDERTVQANGDPFQGHKATSVLNDRRLARAD
jgi:hypothetical protein